MTADSAGNGRGPGRFLPDSFRKGKERPSQTEGEGASLSGWPGPGEGTRFGVRSMRNAVPRRRHLGGDLSKMPRAVRGTGDVRMSIPALFR